MSCGECIACSDCTCHTAVLSSVKKGNAAASCHDCMCNVHLSCHGGMCNVSMLPEKSQNQRKRELRE